MSNHKLVGMIEQMVRSNDGEGYDKSLQVYAQDDGRIGIELCGFAYGYEHFSKTNIKKLISILNKAVAK